MDRVRKPLTDEQRARKNANDRARRAAAKTVVVEVVGGNLPFITDAVVEAPVEPKRGRGRPAGSRNKPKVAVVLVEATEALVEALADLSPLTAAWLRG